MKKSSWFALSGIVVPLMLLAAVGCQSLYTGTITLTAVVDSASKDYARLFNQGLVTPEVAARASTAHTEYRKAAGVARRAFEAVKAGQTADTKTALEAARVAANHFIDVIFPILPPERVTTLRSQLTKAGAP
jgi:hypothetical protein